MQSGQESLRRAMMWVRSATVSDIQQRLGSEVTLPNEYNAPFADPFFWGAFVLYGDWR
jgi:CHAT domain-containing protein